MVASRFYRFAYALSYPEPDRPVGLHVLRDGDAFIEISAELMSRGMRFAGVLLNLSRAKHADASRGLLGTLGPEDLLVVTTRPPLKDHAHETRKEVPLGHTAVEKEVHKALRCCLPYCDRALMRLSPSLARQLPPEFADRAEITFRQNQRKPVQGEKPCDDSAAYKSLRRLDAGRSHAHSGQERTAVFLIRTRLRDDGPWVLCTFAMGGNIALIWAHLLRVRYRDLLLGDRPLFFMGELVLRDIPARPFTLEFSESWEVVPILSTHNVPTIPRDKQYSPKPRPAAAAAVAENPPTS